MKDQCFSQSITALSHTVLAVLFLMLEEHHKETATQQTQEERTARVATQASNSHQQQSHPLQEEKCNSAGDAMEKECCKQHMVITAYCKNETAVRRRGIFPYGCLCTEH